MGKGSAIEYCDDTTNAQMGCDGCELWAPDRGIYSCYAGALTTFLRKGHPGYPADFGKPELFTHRIRQACAWKDLRGTKRENKPWLDGLPRVIFLDDMGDTFTESLPIDWLRPHVEDMEMSGHIWLFLTKRPRRMLEFFRQMGRVPRSFWLGCSFIEKKAFKSRWAAMWEIRQAFPQSILWASWEPAYEPLPWSTDTLALFNWFVFGGESEAARVSSIDIPPARPSHPYWFKSAVELAGEIQVSRFFKQWGAWLPATELHTVYGSVLPPKGVPSSVLLLDGSQIAPVQGGRYETGAVGVYKVGKKKSGATLHGTVIREMPLRAA